MHSIANRNLSSTELECENALEAFLQTPAPVVDKVSGPMGAQFLSSTGLGFGILVGRAQPLPVAALDKIQSSNSKNPSKKHLLVKNLLSPSKKRVVA